MKKWEYKTDTTGHKNVQDILTLLLASRGLSTEAEVKAFLSPKLEDVTLKSVGIDEREVKKTLKRIEDAIAKKEKIIIYGDYDVDGITGTAILWETLYALGANVLPYLPHRIEEGYGLSIKGITNLKNKFPDTSLIITVDNGIVASEAVSYANNEGIDVIITDHHVSAEAGMLSKPAAFAIVHTTQLCGAGVAWLLAKALKSHDSKIKRTDYDHHLELATLGTIADLVPLTGANRTIVLHGLKALRKTERKGLLSLFSESELDPDKIGVYQVGHIIAPRLNATGRMESAMDSLRLLCTKDDKRSRELAGLLGRVNRERQQVMFQATEHASLSVKKRKVLKKLLMVSDETYPEGVIGLVAGRLVEEYYRPAIVIAKGEKTSKGSVRSINGFNIIEFLRNSSEYFVNVGGHPMAAGFTIETEKLEKLQEVLEAAAEELLDDTTLTKTLRIDAALSFTDINQELYQTLQQLQPFGMGNPEPVFASEKVEVKDTRPLGREGKHLKFLLQQDFGDILEAVAFGMGELSTKIAPGDLIDVAYTIDENTWNGKTKLQLKVRDIKKP